MALSDYTSLQQDITSILQTYGTLFKLVRPTLSAGVVTDKVIASSISGTMDAQIASYFSTTNGGIIATDKKTVYLQVLPNLKFEPEVGDRLISGKTSWRVVSVEYFRPDGVTTIAYTLTVT